MNILDQIQKEYPNFTKNEQEIAIFIINNSRITARSTIDYLAMITKTSKAAWVRFTKKLGYNGFSEFKYALSRFLVSNNADVASNYEGSNVLSIINSYIEKLKEMQQVINMETVASLARHIVEARKIRILGVSRTYYSALQLEARLFRIGVDSHAENDGVITGDIIELMGSKDLVIIFTTADNTKCFQRYARLLKENDCPMAIITMNNNLSFKNDCEHYIVLPSMDRTSNFTFLDNQAIFFVFIEILLSEIAKLS